MCQILCTRFPFYNPPAPSSVDVFSCFPTARQQGQPFSKLCIPPRVAPELSLPPSELDIPIPSSGLFLPCLSLTYILCLMYAQASEKD